MNQQVTDTVADRPTTNADVTPQAEAETASRRPRFSTTALRAYTMLFALLVIWGFFQYATADARNPYGLFLNPVNFSKLLQQMAVTGVLATGMLMVIVAGQIDLSVGSVVGLAGGVAAMSQGYGLVPALCIGVLVGVIIGAAQGSLVAYANIPAFIVTLGGLLAWRGAILGLTKGSTIPVSLPVFRSLGRDLLDPRLGWALAVAGVALAVWAGLRGLRSGAGASSTSRIVVRVVATALLILGFIALMNSQGGVPIPVVVMGAVALTGSFLTRNTTFGRYLYAIGGNPDAARLSGISLRRYILLAFCLMGALTGVASLLHTARIGSASPDAGNLMELDAIAACVIGGTSLMGGRGTVAGAILGALIMASLDNGMSLLNVESYVQSIVKGAVLVAAVGFDMLGRRQG